MTSNSKTNPAASSEFHLDGNDDGAIDFQLESDTPDLSDHSEQGELFLPLNNAERPTDTPQLDIQGLEKPEYKLTVEGHSQALSFHYANNLLESLESQGVQVPYQCREGYCGGCRTDLLQGEVAYLQEPMAWINEGEILPCCCVPKSAITLKLKG